MKSSIPFTEYVTNHVQTFYTALVLYWCWKYLRCFISVGTSIDIESVRSIVKCRFGKIFPVETINVR